MITAEFNKEYVSTFMLYSYLATISAFLVRKGKSKNKNIKLLTQTVKEIATIKPDTSPYKSLGLFIHQYSPRINLLTYGKNKAKLISVPNPPRNIGELSRHLMLEYIKGAKTTNSNLSRVPPLLAQSCVDTLAGGGPIHKNWQQIYATTKKYAYHAVKHYRARARKKLLLGTNVNKKNKLFYI